MKIKTNFPMRDSLKNDPDFDQPTIFRHPKCLILRPIIIFDRVFTTAK